MKKCIAAICAVFVICIATFAGAAAGGYGEFVGDMWYYHCNNADELQKSVDQPLPNKVTVLDSSIVLKKQIDIKKEARIDLNGNTISSDRNSRLFFVHEHAGYLILSNGSLSGGYAKYDAGGAIFVRNAGLELKNVKISNCQAQEGGGIAVINGECSMSDSQISNCIADDSKHKPDYKGGGVYIKNGKFIMNSGSLITKCLSDDYGGAVFIESDGYLEMNSGAKITDCTIDDDEGPGIYVKGSGKYHIYKGCEIYDCNDPYIVFCGTIHKNYPMAIVHEGKEFLNGYDSVYRVYPNEEWTQDKVKR